MTNIYPRENISPRSSFSRATHSSVNKWRLLSVMVVEKLDELGETLPRNGDGNTEPRPTKFIEVVGKV